jgi:hypothetical protein
VVLARRRQRGSLEVGKLADLAVLSKDYLTVPVGEIGDIESVLTMVGGKVVYGAGPFKSLESGLALRRLPTTSISAGPISSDAVPSTPRASRASAGAQSAAVNPPSPAERSTTPPRK